MSTTTIRIGKTDKRQLQLIADIENISEREAISRAIGFYELSLMKTWLDEQDFKFSPELIEAFAKAREWLNRMDKKKSKELAKKKGEKQ